MDKNDEVQSEQMEDYCRQLGLQLRDEQDNSAMPVEGTSQISVLGAAQQTQNQSENGQPIAPGHTKLEGTEKTHFECKKCEKSFTNSRQFLKHKCVLKSEGETQKSKGKKRGRKPRVKTSEATEPAGDEMNVDMPKTSTSALVEDQTDHLSDHTYIKDGDNSQTQTPENTTDKIQCKSCQLLAEIDPETANNPDQIPCQKCQDLSTDGKMAEKLTEETGSLEESNKKRKYMFKSEQKNCPHCDKAFHSQKRFDKHILVCKKNLVCSFCNKDFSGSANGRLAYSQYQAHYYTHVETKPFTCTVCSRGFIRKADLDRHNIIHTDNYSPQRCIDCGAVFATKANLSKHMHKHDRITLPCKKCGQQFARQATLDKHVLVCQTQTSCDICGKVFKCLTKNLKSRYQEHMFIHTGEKPYKCQFCDRGFRDRSTRRKHERTHTGEKPYPCTVCDRAFSQLRLLRNHVRTHTGEKPYSCELCPLSFAKSCNLKYHMRVHTKEKPYSCGLCKRSFTQSGTYHKHMRRHTESEQVSATMLQFQVAKAESEDTDDIFVPKGEPGPEEEPGPNGDLLTNPSEQIIELRATMVNDSNPETLYDGCYDDDGTSDMVPEEIDTQIDDTTDVNPEATLDSTATIPEIPTMASDEITIIVSEEDGVTEATLATIDVDQISNILASCS